MADPIDRQAAIDAYGDWYVEEGTEEGFIGTVKQLLEGLPSAQPEIVRCKDCKWWDEIEGSEGVYGYCMAIRHCYFTRNWDIETHRKYDKDFYCADAEMPEVEE